MSEETKPGKTQGNDWPSWRYGPNGEAAVFENEKDVPKGWADTQPMPPEPLDL